MTTIFIKLLCARAGSAVAPPSRPRPGRPNMRNELQRSGSRTEVIERANLPNRCVSTLSLCNANFSPGLA